MANNDELKKIIEKINRSIGRRLQGAERDIAKKYAQTLNQVRSMMSDLYSKYEKDGLLTYSEMAKFDRLKKWMKEIDDLSKLHYGDLNNVLHDVLEKCYKDGFFMTGFAIEKDAQVKLSKWVAPPETITAMINNPVSGLTLDQRLEKNRKDIVYKIQQEVTQGLVKGSTYKEMSDRLKGAVEGDAVKSTRIVRTEGHRVQESSKLDAANHADNNGVVMLKTWNSSLDSRVRHTRFANHRPGGPLVGKTLTMDKDFHGLSGQGPGPGQLHSAAEDINCRCFLTYEVKEVQRKTTQEFENATFEDWQKEHNIEPTPPPPVVKPKPNPQPATIAQPKPKPATKPKDEDFAIAVKQLIAAGTDTEAQIRAIGNEIRKRIEKQVQDAAGSALQEYEKAKKDYVDAKKKFDDKTIELQNARVRHSNGDISIDEVFKIDEEVWKLRDEYRQKYREQINSHNKIKGIRGQEALKALSQVRHMGNPDKDQQQWSSGSNSMVKEACQKAFEWLPTDWIKKTIGKAMKAKKVSRGYYGHGDYALSGGNADQMKTVAIHELGHRMEDLIPEIRQLEYEFYIRRTQGEKLRWLGQGYGRKEKTRFDNFLNPYMGKDYSSDGKPNKYAYYELLSMGLEGVFYGTSQMETDNDYYNFILGLITTK